MNDAFHLPLWLTLSPLVPWALAILGLTLVEHLAGSPVRWADRRTNLIAGAWVLGAIFVTQVSLGLLLALEHALTHTTQAPIALDQGYPGASWLGALAWVAIYDMGYYAFHRLQHRWGWLWRFHAVHHADPAMSASTYVRQHVMETVFQAVLLLLPMVLLFRLEPGTAFVAGLVSGLFQFWIHADLPVHYGRASWLLASPLQHRWHHAREAHVGQVNFAGVFPLWDLLGNTYRPPVPGPRIATGLFEPLEKVPARK